MLKVTDDALVRLSEMLTEVPAASGSVARFSVESDDSMSLQPDEQKPGETVFTHAGKVVLVLDDEAAEVLENMTLDVDDGGRDLVMCQSNEAGPDKDPVA